MNAFETISIDVYPWAAPTDEQRVWFDALPAGEKRRVIREAIDEGFSSPLSDKSIEEILRELQEEERSAS